MEKKKLINFRPRDLIQRTNDIWGINRNELFKEKNRFRYLIIIFLLFFFFKILLFPIFSEKFSMKDSNGPTEVIYSEDMNLSKNSIYKKEPPKYNQPTIHLMYSSFHPNTAKYQSQTLIQTGKSLFNFVHSTVNSGAIPAAALNIYWSHEPVLKVTAGLEQNSIISLASLTKSFTAVAVMQLVERGLLELDKPVSKYGLKIDRGDLGKITVRNLLQHTSGIPYGMRSQKYITDHQFSYSNGNYEHLATLIQKVTGKTYKQYIEENVLQPLDMKDTIVSSWTTGASGLCSSVRDLSNYAMMLLDGGMFNGKRILYPQSIQEMLQPPPFMAVNSTMTYYAHGFRVEAAEGRVVSFYHTGVWNGCFSEVRVFPQENVFLVQLATPRSYKSKALGAYKWKVASLTTQYVKILSELTTGIQNKRENLTSWVKINK